MKKQHQKRARKLAKRRTQPKPRGRGGRGGIAANAWKATPKQNDTNAGDVALATMLALGAGGLRG